MRPENISSVSPHDQKNQLRILWNQKILARYRHKTRKTSSEFHETRKYWLGIPTDRKIWISIPQDQKYIGLVSNETIKSWVSTPLD
jgi:hypothetical protein